MNAESRNDSGDALEKRTSNMRGESIDKSAARIDNNGWRGWIVHRIFACAACKTVEKEISFKVSKAAEVAGCQRR